MNELRLTKRTVHRPSRVPASLMMLMNQGPFVCLHPFHRPFHASRVHSIALYIRLITGTSTANVDKCIEPTVKCAYT